MVELSLGKAVFSDVQISEGRKPGAVVTREDAEAWVGVEGGEILDSASENVVAPEMEAETSVVLIVEDHVEVRQFIRSQLQGNYQILEARNGVEGLLIAQDVIPDLVISDVMMPEMDGTEFCRNLKGNGQDRPHSGDSVDCEGR